MERIFSIMDKNKIVIGIPGKWQNRSELLERIAKDSGGYLFIGFILMHPETLEKWDLEIYDFDKNLAKSYETAGYGSLSPSTLDEIASHTFTCYLIGECDTYNSIRSMMKAVCTLLNAGGIAVKVETTGKAHSKENWFELTQSDDIWSLYTAFITLIKGDDVVGYSCGMHNFGLPDASIQDGISIGDASKLLNTFLIYCLNENPELVDGHTFSIDHDSQYYGLTLEKCSYYPEDDLFYNPYGIWRLRPVQNKNLA